MISWTKFLFFLIIFVIVNGSVDDSLDQLEATSKSFGDNGHENVEKIVQKRQTEEDARKCQRNRADCVKKCYDNSECINKCQICPSLVDHRRVVVESDRDAFVYDSSHPHRNVTTVIKLTNVINNTNVIDVPTNINTTNVNHIHLYQNDSSTEGGKFGLGYSKDGSCCFVVQPRVCTTSSRGYRCHHRRHKTCGFQCTSRIIHAVPRRRCSYGDSPSNCHHNIGYVPQPLPPRCIYTQQWPFVSCGGNYEQFCGGCYDHYGYNNEGYYGSGGMLNHCGACYNEAFDIGPLYRRGPFFRPFCHHQPPCHVYGDCYMSNYGSYGYYGHQFTDPTWGFSGDFPYNEIDNGVLNNGSEDLPIDASSDWGVHLHKCRIVKSDGSTEIGNCTDNVISNNPYASSPLVDSSRNNYQSEIENEFTNNHFAYLNGYQDEDDGQTNSVDPRKFLRKRQTRRHRKHQVIFDD